MVLFPLDLCIDARSQVKFRVEVEWVVTCGGLEGCQTQTSRIKTATPSLWDGDFWVGIAVLCDVGRQFWSFVCG